MKAFSRRCDGQSGNSIEPKARRTSAVYRCFSAVIGCATVFCCIRAEVVELRPATTHAGDGFRVEYRSGDLLVGRATDAAPAGVQLKLPGSDWIPVRFNKRTEQPGVLKFGPETIGPLALEWTIVQKTPSLVERTLEVRANTAHRVAIAFPLDLAFAGEFASFSGPITKRVLCDTVRGAEHTETFPVGMVRGAGKVFGIAADSPGLWENRCQVLIDPAGHRLAVFAGD
ncbi:MAG: hypothetical protein ACP5MD_02025, partial [Verrucomicrobiia bacterium]